MENQESINIDDYSLVKLSSFSTKYSKSKNKYNQNRIFNMKKATDKISYILQPNEEFDWLKKVGIASNKNGYKLAKVIEDGKFVLGYGGGICQVATTLYQAALKANLKILERHKHSTKVGYIKAGQDATISYPTKNLRFLNNTNDMIRLVATVENGIVKVDIYKLVKKSIDSNTENSTENNIEKNI